MTAPLPRRLLARMTAMARPAPISAPPGAQTETVVLAGEMLAR